MAATARQPCAVAAVEALIASVPAVGNAFAEGSEETLLVKVIDEDGRVGIGESVCTPAVVKAMIDQRTIHFWSQGITDMVVGADPVEAAALYDRSYHGSFYHGRRGTYVQAYSAVDIALYDLAGRQLGPEGHEFAPHGRHTTSSGSGTAPAPTGHRACTAVR